MEGGDTPHSYLATATQLLEEEEEAGLEMQKRLRQWERRLHQDASPRAAPVYATMRNQRLHARHYLASSSLEQALRTDGRAAWEVQEVPHLWAARLLGRFPCGSFRRFAAENRTNPLE